MTQEYEIAAGLDIHKQFIVATILSIQGLKIQQRFERTMQGLLALKDWIIDHKCQVVACESTNNFWYHVYDALCDYSTVIVGNAHDMKVMTHKKTDKIDSEIIAKLALKGMITPSRVAPRFLREFRNIVRMRHFLVRKRTDLKNRIHTIFDNELFHLSSVLTDIFGKSGRLIMEGILEGQPVDELIHSLAGQVQKRKGEDIRKLLELSLSPYALMQLRHSLQVMKVLDTEIGYLTKVSNQYAVENYPREYVILLTVPGVGKIAAFTLLAEIGNFKDFPSGDQLASWLGIVHKVYQSADHNSRRSITKRGSRLGRWILVQVAHAAAKRKVSIFFDFYESKKEVIGKGKTTIALARKIITIIWHLVTNDEVYEDKYARPKKLKKIPSVNIPLTFTIDEAIKLFSEASQVLKAPDPGL